MGGGRIIKQKKLEFRRRGSDDRFTIVDPPADRLYADPFLYEHDVRTFVFFEDYSYVVFFFQAEDGIRDWSVTGVQTCALPISPRAAPRAVRRRPRTRGSRAR